MSFNYYFNGAFNVNPLSNLILTVRLTGKLPRTKRTRARQKFIHCVHLQKRILERKRMSEGFEESS